MASSKKKLKICISPGVDPEFFKGGGGGGHNLER